ncbi:MAG TPA: glutamate--tRNA ligase [Pirellulaceae bacterium]
MIRTRFAPSPTGYLHIGGVRTALFNWLFARHHGGQYVLRVDDTDQQRNVEAALQPILDGFRWLGLDWDEGPDVGGPHGPYFQSQRGPRYQRAVAELIDRGAAYYDYALPSEIQAERESAEREQRSFVYSRRWMAESEADRRRFQSEGREAVVRLKMPREGTLVIPDLVRGDVQFAWDREQDHVVQRADGSCLYHLATVVDDHDFQISHVIRAEEHLSNTPRQIFIFQSLGYPLPEFAHIPFVAEPGSKTKLSKRKLDKYLKHKDFKALYDLGHDVVTRLRDDRPKDTFNPVIVDFYREIGFLPDAVVNYLLLLGWSLDDRTEEFTREQMIREFTLERVTKGPASFDPQKLLSVQERYMQRHPLKQKVAAMLPYLQRAGYVASPPPCDTGPYLSRVIEAAGDRLRFAGSILDFTDFFVADDDLVYDIAGLDKRLAADPTAISLLREFQDQLRDVEPFEPAVLESCLKDFLAARGLPLQKLIHPLRIAVTGKQVGFGLFETLAILGRTRCLARIDHTRSLVENRERPRMDPGT